MKDCKHEDWGPVAIGDGLFRDECSECGCIMVPDWNREKDGLIPMKAMPIATVTDINEYRKQKELKKKEVSNG